MKKILVAIIVFGMLAWAGTAMAAPVFYDDFNSENGASGVSNYYGFDNWTVDQGSVDLVGGGYFDELAYEDGLSVDLDGSTNNAGTLRSDGFNVQSGQTYTLSFDIAGNQRGGEDDFFTVKVYVSDYYETFTLAATDEWQTITSEVIVSKSTASIIFDHEGADNIGAVLDNVSFEAAPVPEPATILLMATGLAGFAVINRRKFRKNN